MANVVCDAITTNGVLADAFFLRFQPDLLEPDAAAVVTDSFPYGAALLLLEDGDFVDTGFVDNFPFVREVGVFGEVNSPQVAARTVVREALRGVDLIFVVTTQTIYETPASTQTLTSVTARHIFETGTLTDTSFPKIVPAPLTIQEVGVFTDAGFPAKGIDFFDTADFADTNAPTARVAITIFEVPASTQTLTGTQPLSLTIYELGDFLDVVSARTQAAVRITEEADLEDFVYAAGANAWTANTDTWAASRYAPYDFDAIVSLNGVLYASNALGLYRISGASDAGAAISARVDTGLTEFKEPRLKLAQAIYLGYSSNQSLTATIGVTAGGSESQYDYPMPPRAAAAMVAGRIPLGRGLRSRYMRVVLENTLGGDFAIAEAAIEVDVSTRRV